LSRSGALPRIRTWRLALPTVAPDGSGTLSPDGLKVSNAECPLYTLPFTPLPLGVRWDVVSIPRNKKDGAGDRACYNGRQARPLDGMVRPCLVRGAAAVQAAGRAPG
jgi:hypothetical protein